MRRAKPMCRRASRPRHDWRARIPDGAVVEEPHEDADSAVETAQVPPRGARRRGLSLLVFLPFFAEPATFWRRSWAGLFAGKCGVARTVGRVDFVRDRAAGVGVSAR